MGLAHTIFVLFLFYPMDHLPINSVFVFLCFTCAAMNSFYVTCGCWIDRGVLLDASFYHQVYERGKTKWWKIMPTWHRHDALNSKDVEHFWRRMLLSLFSRKVIFKLIKLFYYYVPFIMVEPTPLLANCVSLPESVFIYIYNLFQNHNRL